MQRTPRTVPAGCLWLAVLLVHGCQPAGTTVPTPSSLTNAQLKSFNLAYWNFNCSTGRSPANIEEFAPFLVGTVFPESHRKMEEECLRLLRAGQYVVIWNQPGVLNAKDGTDIVTAYESRTVEKGGFVIFADGRVQWMTPVEFEQVTRK
jgi:hypothetical protein